MKLYSKFSFILCLSAVFLFTGCATMFGSKNRTINITSNPPKANVEYDGEFLGTTPTDIIVGNTFNPGLVVVSKKGYKNNRKQVQTNFQMVGLLNLFFWPGFIVDLATGNTMGVDKHNMNFVLQPEDPK